MELVRKISRFIEDGLQESGVPINPLYRKVAIAAVVENPYAGTYSDDLSDIVDFSVGLGTLMGTLLADTMEVPVESYGKASVVGVMGEDEHGHAFLTSAMADGVRESIGGGAAWIASTGKKGGPGTTIDVPLAHKDALMVRSHYDTITVFLADSPGPSEIVVIVAAASRGRPNFRLGGLDAAKIVGEDGLR